MKLGLNLGYWGARPPERWLELAQRAEALGFDIVCTAEAYGSDALTPLAAIAVCTSRIRLATAILQISARTPASAAMSAITLDHISNGRLCLGIGVSGPQVVEGWYGQPFRRPLERTREWLDIFERILARKEPLRYEGRQYRLPYDGEGSTGQGKALMSIVHPLRPKIPLFLGAEGPKNVELAATRFDGWFPFMFPPERHELFDEALQHAKSGFEILSSVSMAIGTERERALLPIKQGLALYIGGMGSREENFHKRVVDRCGYKAEADRVQELWLSGRQREAVEAVPEDYARAVSLIGTPEEIRERLAVWRASPVTTLLLSRSDRFETTVANMEFLARELA